MSAAVVDLPFVPVIPMVRGGRGIVLSHDKNQLISVCTGMCFLRAARKNSESFGTAGFRMITSAVVKSVLRCFPNTYEMCGYFFNFLSEGRRMCGEERSVTSTCAPARAKKSAEETPPP